MNITQLGSVACVLEFGHLTVFIVWYQMSKSMCLLSCMKEIEPLFAGCVH